MIGKGFVLCILATAWLRVSNTVDLPKKIMFGRQTWEKPVSSDLVCANCTTKLRIGFEWFKIHRQSSSNDLKAVPGVWRHIKGRVWQVRCTNSCQTWTQRTQLPCTEMCLSWTCSWIIIVKVYFLIQAECSGTPRHTVS